MTVAGHLCPREVDPVARPGLAGSVAVRGLTKTFGAHTVVDALDLDVGNRRVPGAAWPFGLREVIDTTLPVLIFSTLRTGLKGDAAVAATLVMVGTVVLVAALRAGLARSGQARAFLSGLAGE